MNARVSRKYKCTEILGLKKVEKGSGIPVNNMNWVADEITGGSFFIPVLSEIREIFEFVLFVLPPKENEVCNRFG